MKRLLCFVGLLLVASAVKASDRPNIVFFFADDQRNDTLGCAGHPILQTPNIDRVARQGVRFENAFVTTSICWVSRATVLTGMWSRSHGSPERIDAVNPDAACTIYPKLLHEAGYRNGFFGKWHARMPKGFNQSQYFDVYENIFRNPYHKKQPDGTTRHETEVIGDRAVAFIESQPEEQPFCLHLWFNAAHAEDGDKRPGVGHFPWPKAVDGMYDDVDIPVPRLSDPAIYESQPDLLKQSINRERYFWRWDTPEKYTTNMRAYFRMISGIDGVVGRVMKTLEARGLSDNTVVVYSADNGYYMGDRGFAGKWSHYEQSIRVPMIIFDPRQRGAAKSASQTGRVERRLVLNADLPSTFLELAGIPIPDRYEGRSLLPLVRDALARRGSPTPPKPPTEGLPRSRRPSVSQVARSGDRPQRGDRPKRGVVADWREDFLGEHLLEAGARIPKWEGVRGERYVYARYFEYDYEFLHDLEADPDQLKNFVEDPQYEDVLKQLRERCDELRDRYGGLYVSRSPVKPNRPATKPREGSDAIDGMDGKAARFDGRSFLAAGKLPALDRGAGFTWSFWVRVLPGHRRSGVLIGNRHSQGQRSDTFVKFTSHSFQYYHGRQHALRLNYDLPTDQWVHLAAVKDEAKLTVYVDGKAVVDAKVDFDIPELPFYVGGDPHANELSACDIDEVRLYQKALTTEDILALSKRQSIELKPLQHLSFDAVQ